MCALKPMLVDYDVEGCATCSKFKDGCVSTLAMDQAGYCNYLGNGRWKLIEGSLVVARGYAWCGMYMTYVKTYKKKFNEIKDFEKTPQMRVGINGIDTKRVKFSLPNSATKEEVIGDEKYEDV